MVGRAVCGSKQLALSSWRCNHTDVINSLCTEGHAAETQTGEVSGVVFLFLKRCKYIPILSVWALATEQRSNDFTDRSMGGCVSRDSGARTYALMS